MFSSEFVKNYILLIFTLLLISYIVQIIICLISYKKDINQYKESIIKCNPLKNEEKKEEKKKK